MGAGTAPFVRRTGRARRGSVVTARVKVAPTALFAGTIIRATEGPRRWCCFRRWASTNFSSRVGENTREVEVDGEFSSSPKPQRGDLSVVARRRGAILRIITEGIPSPVPADPAKICTCGRLRIVVCSPQAGLHVVSHPGCGAGYSFLKSLKVSGSRIGFVPRDVDAARLEGWLVFFKQVPRSRAQEVGPFGA